MTDPITIQLPDLFGDFGRPYRYRLWHGGRGGGKSWAVARVLIMLAMARPVRVLCCREYQNSIADSVHKLLADQIESLGLSPWFTVIDNAIRGHNGAEFLFKGLARNVQSIKSTEGVDVAWVEEAHTLSQESLDLLLPTIRKEGAELWFTWNPQREDAPIETLRKSLLSHKDAFIAQVNWSDNPWFPATLNAERLRCYHHAPSTYNHIWEGAFQRMSEALIFRNHVRFDAFETPKEARFYFGVDWGDRDPTAVVRCFIADDILHIDHEAGGSEIDLNTIGTVIKTIPESDRWPIRADCSQPAMIRYIAKEFGLRISGADKWPGSVEDGIARLKAFKAIRIHPRCPHTAHEFRAYSYKIDRITGDVLPKIDDANNHWIDAIRYALDGIIQNRRTMPDFSTFAGKRVVRRSFI